MKFPRIPAETPEGRRGIEQHLLRDPGTHGRMLMGKNGCFAGSFRIVVSANCREHN
jgi:hypothetical protein